MFCKDCGKEILDGAEGCPSCGNAPQSPVVNIKTYLIPAVISTLCCCIPFGIVAIVYASRVSSLLQAGDISGAAEASSKAKMWTWIALIAGVFSILIFLGLQVLAKALSH